MIFTFECNRLETGDNGTTIGMSAKDAVAFADSLRLAALEANDNGWCSVIPLWSSGIDIPPIKFRICKDKDE